jgi:FG-GAP-like repeat
VFTPLGIAGMGAMGILTSAVLSVVLFIASSGLAYAVVQFEDVTAPAGVVTGSAQGSGLASGSAWRDFNGDGLPDLFVGNHYDLPALFRNQGNGTSSPSAS